MLACYVNGCWVCKMLKQKCGGEYVTRNGRDCDARMKGDFEEENKKRTTR
jgi:hypothetical protein